MSASGARMPCLDCQQLCQSSRCDDCRRARERTQQRGRKRVRTGRVDRIGTANTQWRRLSRQARTMQNWCSDCHRSADQLQEHEQLVARVVS